MTAAEMQSLQVGDRIVDKDNGVVKEFTGRRVNSISGHEYLEFKNVKWAGGGSIPTINLAFHAQNYEKVD